jgi:peptidoglycan-N-acetylglucosamine deacetylase
MDYAGIIRFIYPGVTCTIPSENKVFITFDDGPTPGVTDKVLDILNQFNAKATFFCLGKNVAAYPELFSRIVKEGHMVGNHGFNHLNGFKTRIKSYIDNVKLAEKYIESELFRPPYGKIRPLQRRQLLKRFKIVMWSVLSKDYNMKLTDSEIIDRVSRGLKPGAIIVFHDSEKTKSRIIGILKASLQEVNSRGLICESIPRFC